jgi:hypothetical protein
MSYIKDRVIAALEALPNDPDLIAEKFCADGITGIVGNVYACPLNTYIRRAVPELANGYLTTWGMVLWDQGDFSKRVTMPDAAFRFACRFDDGFYPELEDK